MEIAYLKYSSFLVTRRQTVRSGEPNPQVNHRDYSYKILCNKPRTWQSIWEAERGVSDYKGALLSVEPLKGP